ncbi:HAMP domain-containing sensor histidine kinase [Saccharibacillus sacchari]|uniref:HAMP domain-containing sensor histidine kinase n=1 Tax=Saccharibacillus sacchari TaxID=456493 RepID=A0ACC6PEM4_9BACL
MYIRNWIRGKTAAALILLLLILCSGIWLANTGEKRSAASDRYPVNKARLLTGNIMFELEQSGLGALDGNERLREQLLRQCREIGAELTLVDLRGTVAFDSMAATSSPSAPSDSVSVDSADTENRRVDLRTALHYDLYASSEPERFEIAFPIVEAGGAQTGNALFTLDASAVLAAPDRSGGTLAFAVFALLLLLSGWTTVLVYRRLQARAVEPLTALKQAAETILKGEYDWKSEYARPDEMGELYAAFEQMRLEISHLHGERERRERMQKELVTDISHDLKTPLTAIKAYIEAIEAGLCADLDEVMEYIGVMRVHTDKMVRLTDDLLVHALNELGQISITPLEVYSADAFRSILRTVERDITSSGIAYRGPDSSSFAFSPADGSAQVPENGFADISGIPNVLIRADVNRLEQVMSNLVTNALKHTRSGDTICIGLELEPGFLGVSVADTGTGIDPADRPFIFERAYKGSAARSNGADLSVPSARKNDGSGLGLSICKTIIEAHGGTLSFQSRKGNGTVFRFTVPLC